MRVPPARETGTGVVGLTLRIAPLAGTDVTMAFAEVALADIEKEGVAAVWVLARDEEGDGAGVPAATKVKD